MEHIKLNLSSNTKSKTIAGVKLTTIFCLSFLSAPMAFGAQSDGLTVDQACERFDRWVQDRPDMRSARYYADTNGTPINVTENASSLSNDGIQARISNNNAVVERAMAVMFDGNGQLYRFADAPDPDALRAARRDLGNACERRRQYRDVLEARAVPAQPIAGAVQDTQGNWFLPVTVAGIAGVAFYIVLDDEGRKQTTSTVATISTN